MATIISLGTPYFCSARASASAFFFQNLMPPRVRFFVTKIGRYSYQGLPSAGRAMASNIES